MSFKENPDCFVYHFATLFFVFDTNLVRERVSPFLSVRKMSELAKHFLHESDKLVFGPLTLLSPE